MSARRFILPECKTRFLPLKFPRMLEGAGTLAEGRRRAREVCRPS
jgi:hypothetical protein